MINKVLIALCLILLTGCTSSKIIVRSLDSAIIEAAQQAKAAGAESVKIEVSVESGYKGTASIPISIVTVGGEKSGSNSTKVTVTLDLTKWSPPSQDTLSPVETDYYVFDPKTKKLESYDVSYTVYSLTEQMTIGKAKTYAEALNIAQRYKQSTGHAATILESAPSSN